MNKYGKDKQNSKHLAFQMLTLEVLLFYSRMTSPSMVSNSAFISQGFAKIL